MARGGDEASTRRLIGRIGRPQPILIERCPIGLEPLRHDWSEFVVGAEHPYGAIDRERIELAVRDSLDPLATPCLDETGIDRRTLRAGDDQHLSGAERLRQRRWNFEGAQPAIELKLRIDLDALCAP